MGFGVMFLGLFFMFPTVPFPADTGSLSGIAAFIAAFFGGSGKNALGFVLLLLGACRAARHCRCFDLTKRLCEFGIVASLADFAFGMIIGESGVATRVMYVLFTLFLLGFFICYMRSLLAISTETGVEKIRRHSASGVVLSLLFVGIGRLCGGMGDLIPSLSEKTAYWISVGGFSAQVVFTLYAMYVTFSCYMWICLEGDEDMPDNRKFKYVTPVDIYGKGRKK